MVRTGVQLYTLRSHDEPLGDTLGTLDRLGYDGVEFAGFDPAEADDAAAALADSGLAAAGIHVGADEIESEYSSLVEACEVIDCDRLVVPSYDPEAFETAEGVDAVIDRLDALADRLAADGIDLHYHNHGFEFADVGGETALDRLAAGVDALGIEVDAGLAHHAGVDPIALIERHADRVELVHLTDAVPGDDDRRHADLGTGTVDLQGCVDAALEANAEWLLFEQGLTDDPMQSVEDAKAVLDDLLSGE